MATDPSRLRKLSRPDSIATLQRRMLLLTVLLAGTGALGERAALAETGVKQARVLQRQGLAKARAGDHETALELFQKAYAAHPDPRILLDLGRAQEKLGQERPALESYRRYLEALPRAKDKAEVERIVAELEAVVARDDERQREAAAAAASPPPIALAPPPAVSVAQTRDDDGTDPSWYHDKLGWTLAGGGCLLAAVGGGLYLRAQAQKDDIPSTPEGDRAELRGDIGRTQTMGGTAIVIGGMLVAAGIVKFVLTERAANRHRVEVAWGPTSIALRGSF